MHFLEMKVIVTEQKCHSAVAIMPCNDIVAAEHWWSRLGFRRSTDNDCRNYQLLSDGHGGELHLQVAPEGWMVPGRNPFGIYLYVARVDQLASMARDAIIGSSKAPEHKSWARSTSHRR